MRKAADHFGKQRYRFLIEHGPPDQTEQDGVINAVKKLTNIAFERPARSGVVTADRTGKLLKSANRGVRAFSDPARVGIVDERLLEQRSKRAIQSMVHDPVADIRLMDDPVLGIKNLEPLIRRVTVRAVFQFGVQTEQIVLKSALKILHIPVPSLP